MRLILLTNDHHTGLLWNIQNSVRDHLAKRVLRYCTARRACIVKPACALSYIRLIYNLV